MVIVARDITYDVMLTSIREVKTRKVHVITVAEDNDEAVRQLANFVITVRRIEPVFSLVVNTVALHLLAYYTVRERSCRIDFPCNLAKNVTVE